MIVTSIFLMNLMCSFVPCDPNYGEPKTSESVTIRTPKKFRFSRSGVPKAKEVKEDNFLSAQEEEELDPIVETKSGVVEGYIMKIINSRKIYAFEGIEFGEPPIGHLRFRNPVPKQSWSGIRPAKAPGPICLQYHVRKVVRITGEEDCLRLNIYSPALPSEFKGKAYKTGFPTLIWIHGGGYFFGAGSEFGPSYLLQEDVVLVTINYRLGVLGFLSTGDEESPGNYGLKDQALAIKWISENIAAFGGDPKKITLMGQSAGSAAAHLHMMSPLTKHLISGVISSSGTAMNHWAVSSPARSLRLTRKLAENIGCPTTAGSKTLMDCFRASNPHFLLHEQQKLYDFMTFPPILFAPVIERPGPQAFLPDTPENMYSTNQVANIPWICGQTTEEGESFALAFKHVGKIPFYKRNFDRFAPYILDYWYVAKNSSEVTAKIRDVYFGTEGPNPSAESIRIVSDLVSDRYFRVGIHRALALHSKIAPTYASLFGFRSQIGFPSIWGDSPNDYGVGHASDNGFYFNSSLYFLPLKLGTPSYDVSRMLINLAANFARKREPFLTYRNGNVIKLWKPAMYHGKDLRFLLIDNENVVMIPEPRKYAIRFWESLGLADTPVTLLSTAEPHQESNDADASSTKVPVPPIPPPIDNYGDTDGYGTPYMQSEYSTYVENYARHN
ncbi:unnamed protein product [Orchesella dallaii]|uniref:Carboxylic ester hydrolase n=1 Tax=Orchesella dallaii TaxID=48710 RepID=A0ABP1QXB9_9HEXA